MRSTYEIAVRTEEAIKELKKFKPTPNEDQVTRVCKRNNINKEKVCRIGNFLGFNSQIPEYIERNGKRYYARVRCMKMLGISHDSRMQRYVKKHNLETEKDGHHVFYNLNTCDQ